MSEIELRKVKPKVYLAALGFLAIILSFTVYQSYFNNQLLPVNPQDKQQIDIVIPADSNARQIALLLKEHNLIRSKSIFTSYCRRNDLDNQLKAGHFQFSRSQSLQEIVLAITQGKTVSLTLTIPEGYTVKQIGELLVKKNICSSEQWQQALLKDYNYEFLKTDGKKHGLEGFLFPDTYSISEKPTAEEIINMMLKNYATIWNNNFAKQAQEKNIDMYQVITLASMIEKEAKLGSERKIISGVIKNRLRKGMPLQIDATVIYCLGEHRDSVTYQDLKVDSPYNTYKYSGLPPGPIACPGKASIDAALNPAPHSYYYYVSKGDGSHYFSRTYAEHLQAQAKYIK
jgi:UPF0755 protein